jgi:hypothetical protein
MVFHNGFCDEAYIVYLLLFPFVLKRFQRINVDPICEYGHTYRNQ